MEKEKLTRNPKPNAPVQIKSNWGVAVKESEIGLLLSFEPIRAPRFPEAHVIKWMEQFEIVRARFSRNGTSAITKIKAHRKKMLTQISIVLLCFCSL
jgi:hypothetical protein